MDYTGRKIRAITAFRATIADRKAFLENTK